MKKRTGRLKCLFGHHSWKTGIWLRQCHICNTVEVAIERLDVWAPIITKAEYKIIRDIVMYVPKVKEAYADVIIDKEIFDNLSIEMFND